MKDSTPVTNSVEAEKRVELMCPVCGSRNYIFHGVCENCRDVIAIEVPTDDTRYTTLSADETGDKSPTKEK